MTELTKRKGFIIESTIPQIKKSKNTKSKPKGIEHVKIIDDDALIPWNTTIAAAAAAVASQDNVEIASYDDAPVVVGILDERPSEIKEKERFKDMKRWHTAAFEEIPEPGTIGPQPKSSSSSLLKSHQKQHLSDDSDPDIDRRQSKRDNDLSPPRRKRPSNDDPSPPRRRRQSDDDPSPPRQKRNDSSPPRKRLPQANDDFSPPRRRDSSPPRRKHKSHDTSNSSRSQDRSSPSHRKTNRHSRQDSPPSSTHHRQPKIEPSSPSTYRRPKQESPPPPSQPAKSERRRLAEHKEQITERYTQWGRGLAQVQRAEDSVKEYLELAEKPLARYRDDKDLDAMLKQKERQDDPMLKYLSNKTSDGVNPTNNSNNGPVKPRYRGPDPQKNRFDIWPGYRWDGVDRSNGYEKKLFESIANRHAKAQEAYLWSVEDM